MWTVSEVANRDGVSKPTVSIRVKRFRERHQLHVELDDQGRVARLNVAQYDALRGKYDDPSKAQQASRPVFEHKPGESYDEAVRQRAWLDAERRRLEIDEIKGRLVPTSVVAEALDRVAQVFRDAMARVDEAADDFAAAVGRDGARGARAECKRLRAEMEAMAFDGVTREARNLRANEVDEAPSARQ